MKITRIYQIIIALLVGIIILQWFFIVEKCKRLPHSSGRIRGKIAIVIDDWGYNLHNLPVAEKIRQNFTVAILPNLPYSSYISQRLKEHGVEIALHLPLEPMEKYRLEKNTIFINSSREDILRILNDDLASVKYARGVSNHMGSRATGDERVMRIIFSELKRRRLYFLDNMDTHKSVCGQVAKEVGLAWGRRGVFLDNSKNAEYIKGQFFKLKRLARKYGQAIGVGHDNKVTVETLKGLMAEAEKEGYQFVFLSGLLK
ncbi:MAG: divergent polysaccharide deacetylase family protein [Candidatus Omnitrophica bacterium]|nr:divergent polysaccharide deacetylase family protein [Candidatus Omnitrophota bacterium]